MLCILLYRTSGELNTTTYFYSHFLLLAVYVVFEVQTILPSSPNM